jgi:ribosomal protein S18 acetylase RimI-like enzyme
MNHMIRQLEITALSQDDAARHGRALAALLHACVQDGASIGFVLPFSVDDAEAYWAEKVLPRLDGGKLMLLAARQYDRLVGAVQLDCDTPPNQPHRAEVRKLLVHPEFRRQGIAKTLMAALEHHAGEMGRSLLTLDTRSSDKAEPLYASLGYQIAGVIPGYCRDPFTDRLDPTTVMYKAL